jgi:hypothetical protein
MSKKANEGEMKVSYPQLVPLPEAPFLLFFCFLFFFSKKKENKNKKKKKKKQ